MHCKSLLDMKYLNVKRVTSHDKHNENALYSNKAMAYSLTNDNNIIDYNCHGYYD